MGDYLELANALREIASGDNEYAGTVLGEILKDAADAIVVLEAARFPTEKQSKVLYICDRRACDKCNPDCKHTADVRHAENFEVTFCEGVIMERDHAAL